MEEEAGKNKDGWVIEMAAIHEIIVNRTWGLIKHIKTL